jgi:hypothetical protein
MKLQEVEWFAARVSSIAHAQRALDRKEMVKQLQRRGDPIAADYNHAARTAEVAARVARSCGAYPLLSGGDVNVYSLLSNALYGWSSRAAWSAWSPRSASEQIRRQHRSSRVSPKPNDWAHSFHSRIAEVGFFQMFTTRTNQR